MTTEGNIPISYESSFLEKEKKVAQKFTKDGEEIRVSLYEFSNDGEQSAELLLALIQNFDNMVTTYDLFNTLSVTKVIDRFRRCLSGTALQDWDLIRQAAPNNTQANFLNCKFSLIEEVMDIDVAEDTINYLKRTKKPRDLCVKKWIKRMRLINSYVPQMENGAVLLTEQELIKECIRPNYPRKWQKDFEMYGGKEKVTVKEVTQVLQRIEKWEVKEEKGSDKKKDTSKKRKFGDGK